MTGHRVATVLLPVGLIAGEVVWRTVAIGKKRGRTRSCCIVSRSSAAGASAQDVLESDAELTDLLSLVVRSSSAV
jgi:hypothetical protein